MSHNIKSKVIQFLKEKEEYVSGEEISNFLGVSRTAIWKTISGLREEGYVIKSVTNKGYYLKDSPDILTEEEISLGLETKYFGNKIYHYKKVDSTNKEAKRLARKGEKEGIIVIAEEQLEGKGRLGRNWVSPCGTGIWMSVILRPRISPLEVSKITLIAGLSVCKAIEKTTDLKPQIKWPNDIIINNKKICGILTEMSAEMDKVNYIILGIGLNVNTKDFPETINEKATSLKLEGKKDYNRKQLTRELLVQIEGYYEAFTKENSIDILLEEYKKYCLTLGKKIKVIQNGMEYNGDAIDLNAKGELIVKKENGEIINIFSGEVSVRGIYGYI